MSEIATFAAEADGFTVGPKRLVLLGPPGTGKTYTSIESFLLPALRDHSPRDVLSTSFTRAAARELRERLAKRTGRDAQDLRVMASTVHAEALRIVGPTMKRERLSILKDKEEPQKDDAQANDEEADERARFADADDEPEDEEAAIERTAPEEQLSIEGLDDTNPRVVARKLWDLARNSGVETTDDPRFAQFALDMAPDFGLGEMVQEVALFESAKRAARRVDFTDLIIMAAREPGRPRRLLVVDEAQDCSALQWRLIDRWIAASETVVLIGDFDQTIYEWAVADPAKLQALVEAGFAVRRLHVSRRVPRAAHRFSRALIRLNADRIDAAYEPADRDGLICAVSGHEAALMLRDLPEGQTAFVLARGRMALNGGRMLPGWTKKLADMAVPFLNERGASPLGAKAACSVARAGVALRAGAGSSMPDAIRLLAALPVREGEFFTRRGKGGGRKGAVSYLRGLDPDMAIFVSTFLDAGVQLSALLDGDLSDALRLARLEDRANTLAMLVDRLGPVVLSRDPAVRLTTFHGSKGREANVVILDAGAPKRVAQGIASGDSVESERRLLYVAATRTKDKLCVVRSGERDLLSMLHAPRLA